jgi:hypothetical protein
MRDWPRCVVGLCLLLTACVSSSDPPGDPDAATDARAIDADPLIGDDGPNLCFLDCFPVAYCNAGELRAATGPTGATYPCDQPPPFQCPVEITACPAGCLAEQLVLSGNGTVSDPAVFHWLCRSGAPAVAGQACDTDADCTPTFAIPSTEDPRLVVQDYLRCGSGGTCEAAAAPVIAGYGAPCTVASSGGFGVFWGENTAAGGLPACLAGDGCSSATITCDGDWQCPAGSRCDHAIPRADATPSTTGVCRPGSASPLRGDDLACP